MKALVDRFFSKVEKTDACWNWKGSKNGWGYSTFGVEGKIKLGHRVSYQMFKGPIPEGLTVDHLCGNHGCVNPSHLEAVTLKENLMRSNCSSAINARKTHCKNGHLLAPPNLKLSELARGTRDCRICRNAYQRNYYAVKLEHLPSQIVAEPPMRNRTPSKIGANVSESDTQTLR